MIEIKEIKEFEDLVLHSQNMAVVAFSAPWCGPCRMLAPVLEEFSKQAQQDDVLKVFKVNVDDFTELAAEYNIQSVPTVLFFSKGKNIALKAGFMSISALTKWVDEHKS